MIAPKKKPGLWESIMSSWKSTIWTRRWNSMARCSSSLCAARATHNAFIDLGDQFIQLTLGRSQVADTKRHFGFVVDDRDAVRRAMDRLGMKSINDRLNILDPWGNRIEIVPYADCQFTKASHILKGMGVEVPAKTASAIEELHKKGMAPE